MESPGKNAHARRKLTEAPRVRRSYLSEGFFWIARKQDGSRSWPVRLAMSKKSKEFGPDAVKNSATALGLKPSEGLTRILEDNAKAEKAARKADK